MSTPKKVVDTPKPQEVKTPAPEAPATFDDRTEDQKAAEDQRRLEEATKRKQLESAKVVNSDAPSLEETHKQALESVAASNLAQNTGFAGAIANQMASDPAHPDAVKTIAEPMPRVRHISEFLDGYTGHPDDVKNLDTTS